MRRNKLPCVEFLRSILKYDENSPSGLIWIDDRHNSVKVGGVAGYISQGDPTKYWNIHIYDKCYKNHNVIWKLIYNEDIENDYILDHIDYNGLNNKISNLRKVVIKHNAIHKRHFHSKSGYVGIVIQESGSFLAYFNYNNKNYRKIFKKFSDALEYRLENVLKYYDLYNTFELNNIKLKHPELFEKVWERVFNKGETK